MKRLINSKKNKRKIIYRADTSIIINKIKDIIFEETKKHNGKIYKIEVPFKTEYLITECDGIKTEHNIKKVMGIDIVSNCKKLKIHKEDS